VQNFYLLFLSLFGTIYTVLQKKYTTQPSTITLTVVLLDPALDISAKTTACGKISDFQDLKVFLGKVKTGVV